MANATMKLVSVAVTCRDQLETPEQKLDDGESITIRVVELAKLNQILKGKRSLVSSRGSDSLIPKWTVEYGLKVRAVPLYRQTLRSLERFNLQENYMVDAKLASFAGAYDLGRNPRFQ